MIPLVDDRGRVFLLIQKDFQLRSSLIKENIDCGRDLRLVLLDVKPAVWASFLPYLSSIIIITEEEENSLHIYPIAGDKDFKMWELRNIVQISTCFANLLALNDSGEIYSVLFESYNQYRIIPVTSLPSIKQMYGGFNDHFFMMVTHDGRLLFTAKQGRLFTRSSPTDFEIIELPGGIKSLGLSCHGDFIINEVYLGIVISILPDQAELPWTEYRKMVTRSNSIEVYECPPDVCSHMTVLPAQTGSLISLSFDGQVSVLISGSDFDGKDSAFIESQKLSLVSSGPFDGLASALSDEHYFLFREGEIYVLDFSQLDEIDHIATIPDVRKIQMYSKPRVHTKMKSA